MKIVVFLAAMTRGGVDFFQSLLDEHPQISQLPGSFYVDEFFEKIENQTNLESIAKAFISSNESYFDSRHSILERHNSLGSDKNEFYIINEDSFIKEFINLMKDKTINEKEILIAIHLAYSKASGQNIEKKKLIFLQIHHIFRFNVLKDIDFEILCIIRDPIASYSSYIKNLATFKNKNINPWQFFFHLQRTFFHIKDLLNIKNKLSVIKLEDVHHNNLYVMKNFCNKFDLKYDSCMQKSTFQGKLWWGDQVGKRDINGINKNFKNKIDFSVFFEKDIRLIEFYHNKFLQKYNYPSRSTKKVSFVDKFLPLKTELLIFKSHLLELNIKQIFFSIYYYIKRINLMNKKKIESLEYPNTL